MTMPMIDTTKEEILRRPASSWLLESALYLPKTEGQFYYEYRYYEYI